MYNIIVNSKMDFLNFMESFFFISLGITFIFILLLVYHFKERIINLEQKSDTMFEIINNVVKELSNVKQNVSENVNNYSKIPINMFPISPFSNILNSDLNTFDQTDNHTIKISESDCNDEYDHDETVSLNEDGSEDEDEDEDEDEHEDSEYGSEDEDEEGSVYDFEEVSNQTDKIKINYDDMDGIDNGIHDVYDYNHILGNSVIHTPLEMVINIDSIKVEEIKESEPEIKVEEIKESEPEIKVEEIVEKDTNEEDADADADIDEQSIKTVNIDVSTTNNENKDSEEQIYVNKVININDKDLYHKMTISQLKTIVISKGLATDINVNKYKKGELIKLIENITE